MHPFHILFETPGRLRRPLRALLFLTSANNPALPEIISRTIQEIQAKQLKKLFAISC